MADLTFGEVGKVLRLNLVQVDMFQNPPLETPLPLAAGTKVYLRYVIGKFGEDPTEEREMAIVDATLGIVQYTFQTGDLAQPSDFEKFGKFLYQVLVKHLSGVTLYSTLIGELSIQVPL